MRHLHGIVSSGLSVCFFVVVAVWLGVFYFFFNFFSDTIFLQHARIAGGIFTSPFLLFFFKAYDTEA